MVAHTFDKYIGLQFTTFQILKIRCTIFFKSIEIQMLTTI